MPWDPEAARSLLAHSDAENLSYPPRGLRGHTDGPGGQWARAGAALLPAWLRKALGGFVLVLVGCAIGRASSGRRETVRYVLQPEEVGRAVNFTELRERPYDPLPPGIANALTLNSSQCDAAFPLLWPEVEQTAAAFRYRADLGRKGITMKDIEAVEQFDGSRVAVVDGQVYVKRFNGESKLRSEAILNSLQLAVKTSPEPFPDVEFVFRCTDNLDPGARFGLTKEHGGGQMFLLPDFGFESWPEPRVLGWQDARRKAMAVEEDLSWRKKETKLFWRGALGLGNLRNALVDAANKHPWGDIGDLNWGNGEGRINMEDHCTRKFLASADSHSYSGRLKYLLLCRSVIVSHKKRWMQHFHPALDGRDGSPTQNWVELKEESWAGLEEAMEGLIAEPARAEMIAENAVRSMRDRYLTPASIACYWRRVLSEYAALQRFTPTRGGIDFESFNLIRKIDFAPS
ncbi:hypothetical protein JCM10213_008766 [Rhodosporidiobolus nylandii]